MAGHLTVLATGPLATLQDRGRPGWAHVGVGRAGAADRSAHALANRIVGNDPGQATVEALFGGLVVRTDVSLVVAVTGAPAPVTVNDAPADHHAPLYLAPGDTVALGLPAAGLRCYLAVAGGLDVPPVLGSRSWDSLAALGPPPLESGARLRLAGAPHEPPTIDAAPVLLPTGDAIEVAVAPGPRQAWVDGGLDRLAAGSWTVSARSDRVGVRLEGTPLVRAPCFADRELASEGVVRGAVQVPANGLPVVFGSDHPVTGGYPVIGVLGEADADRVAQARPGQALRFRRLGSARHLG